MTDDLMKSFVRACFKIDCGKQALRLCLYVFELSQLKGEEWTPEIKIDDIAKKLKVERSTAAKAISELRMNDSGYLESERPGNRECRYRLTEKFYNLGRLKPKIRKGRKIKVGRK